MRTFFWLKQKNKTGGKPLIHGLGGWLARPSRHFVILEGSGNGKVQKVSPKAIGYKRKLQNDKCYISKMVQKSRLSLKSAFWL